MMLFLLLGCASITGFGSVADAVFVSIEGPDGELGAYAQMRASRNTCPGSDDGGGSGDPSGDSLCEVLGSFLEQGADHVTGSSDRSDVLSLNWALGAEAVTDRPADLVERSPCYGSGDPSDIEPEELSVTATVELDDDVVTIDFDGELSGSIQADRCDDVSVTD